MPSETGYAKKLKRLRNLEEKLVSADPAAAAKLTREIVRLKAAVFNRKE